MARPNPQARISGVVLAAGRSSRFGGRAKQLLVFDGDPLVRRTCHLALGLGLHEVVVVVGHEGEGVAAAVADLEVRTVTNPAFAAGLSTSVRAGLDALEGDAEGVIFLPCDQPYLDRPTVRRLIARFENGSPGIVVPVHRGRRGAPVLVRRRHFPELGALRGDEGGRQLLRRHPDEVAEVELESLLPLLDVDAEDDLEHLEAEVRREAASGSTGSSAGKATR